LADLVGWAGEGQDDLGAQVEVGVVVDRDLVRLVQGQRVLTIVHIVFTAIRVIINANRSLKEVATAKQHLASICINRCKNRHYYLPILHLVHLSTSCQISDFEDGVECDLDELRERLEQCFIFGAKGQCFDDGAPFDSLLFPVAKHVQKEHRLPVLAKIVFELLVWVELKA